MIGQIVYNEGFKWRVAAIYEKNTNHSWAWLVRIDKPEIQVRLSLRAKCFK